MAALQIKQLTQSLIFPPVTDKFSIGPLKKEDTSYMTLF